MIKVVPTFEGQPDVVESRDRFGWGNAGTVLLGGALGTELSCKIGGKAGEGIMVTGAIFSKILLRHGYHVIDSVEYPSLVKGGHNVYCVRAAQERMHAQRRGISLLVALDAATIEGHQQELARGASLIYDSDSVDLSEVEPIRDDLVKHGLPLVSMAEAAGGKIMRNTVALGAAAGLIGCDRALVTSVIGEAFAGKGSRIREGNEKAATAGYGQLAGEGGWGGRPLAKRDEPKRMLVTGNEAISLGA
ncbi:MAG: 2-oxoacid:acceptor oxidoreductase family protein, partial [Terriglobia bacterium]